MLMSFLRVFKKLSLFGGGRGKLYSCVETTFIIIKVPCRCSVDPAFCRSVRLRNATPKHRTRNTKTLLMMKSFFKLSRTAGNMKLTFSRIVDPRFLQLLSKNM